MNSLNEYEQAYRAMQPGIISRDGFLGTDTDLETRIQKDNDTVRQLGLTHSIIADRMEELTRYARNGIGKEIVYNDVFALSIKKVRGSIICPWQHPGLYPKELTQLKRIDTHQTGMWTALHIHLIRAHGFYEGMGSSFRLDPVELKSLLWA